MNNFFDSLGGNFFAIAGIVLVVAFFTCIGMITCTNWIINRFRPMALPQPDTTPWPTIPRPSTPASNTAAPMRLDDGPRDWKQQLRP